LKNVGIAHRKDTEYLKTIPDDSNDNNLSWIIKFSKIAELFNNYIYKLYIKYVIIKYIKW
jgi:hypothetical protein